MGKQTGWQAHSKVSTWAHDVLSSKKKKLYSSQAHLSSFVSSDTFEVQFYDQPAVQGTRIALEMQLRFLTNGELGKGKHFVTHVPVPFILFFHETVVQDKENSV